jgi:predicted MPP superfamily phosphohydrolase
MPRTIILRFRDIIADTIALHQQSIAEHGTVWWGWWRKPTEPERLNELGTFSARLKDGPQQVGLYDKSRQAFFLAIVDRCVFSGPGQFLESPASRETPEYYRREKLPAWFRMRSIEAITELRFVDLFLGVPIGDETLYPVGDVPLGAGAHGDSIDAHPSRLRGNTILHLTDIHFGADFGFPFVAQPGQEPLLDIVIRDSDAIARADIGLVVVSGDLTSRGDASHLFNNGLPFLEKLCKHLTLAPDQVVIVPGNHDISFKEFSPTYDHERAYNTFLQSFYGAATQQHRLLRYELPNGRSLEVLTISSVKLRHKATSNYGWVDWQACESLLKTASVPPPNTLRLAVLHHHLMSALRDDRLPDPQYPDGSVSVTLNSGAVIEGLQRYGFGLVLHGHQHTPGLYRVARGQLGHGSLSMGHFDEPLYALAGGSAGARADRIDGDVRDNSYALVQIDSQTVNATVRAYNPSGAVRDLFNATLRL